ncbi:hypothetical protein IG197_08670 [Aminobacter sp. SR38]|jgi:hypothetical protein|uniref:hypothetical protein n=1 Tax=Aminobacter TaxID=31988 RepID=UPI0017809C40|nr:hypothetical protein [Aminobacter sp. SR38]QOF73109.1 hypothetical protein IG197_08670 [Aminobacter sp. SR38]
MPDPKPLDLSRLRAIGWSTWDPIGLREPGADWCDQPFTDEYDSYLIEAASGLGDGWSVEKARDLSAVDCQRPHGAAAGFA